jgi:predicted N-acetyltransferase YhbS
MSITLRPVRPDDATTCGRICYEAFKSIADRHNFSPDFSSADAGIQLLTMLASNPGFHGVVAEKDGRIVGSNFLDERSTIGGIGPITVDPVVQDGGIGRRLMQHVLARVAEKGRPGVRLVQSAYHNRSLSLYTKLGFETREPLSNMQGPPLATRIPGYDVRPATADDVPACSRLCLAVHGHNRTQELRDGIALGLATVVERGGRITGYASMVGFMGHAVGETTDDIKALIAAAPTLAGPGFLVPTRNTELFRWCLEHGFRLAQQMTLMTIGLYNEPRGAHLPSVLY